MTQCKIRCTIIIRKGGKPLKEKKKGNVYRKADKGEHMTVIKSIAFCIGWIIAASIGLWAMVLYGAFFAIKEMR